MRAYTGAVPGSGKRSNLGNIMRAHMEGLKVDVLRRNRDAAFLCFDIARQLTWERAKVATRRYLDAWTYEARPTGAIVYNNAAHATMIEIGRQPGTYPPPHRITDWFDAKAVRGLGGLTYFVGPRGGDWRRRQLIFQISKSINDKGIKAEPIMKEAADEARTLYTRQLVYALLYYHARTGEQSTQFAGNLRFVDSSGRTQKALPNFNTETWDMTPHRDFAGAWATMQQIGLDLQPAIDMGTPPPPFGASGQLPGRDY